MAQPRVFISSTYYDLKYVRSSLELFVESLGYEPVLSEKGGVAYSPDCPLDESCYREVQNCDIYVLIIGGRYGSEVSSSRGGTPREFFENYESVTKLEYGSAVEKDMPIYILIERSVYAEYQTFQKNRESADIKYAHVDSVNVYRFIDDILSRPRNNPVQPFERFSEIEEWLRLQWAGLFRDLILRMSNQHQLSTLASQVAELSSVNQTLRRYLEEVIAKVSPKESAKIIHAESERLAEATLEQRLRGNRFVEYLIDFGVPFTVIREGLEKADNLKDFQSIIAPSLDSAPSFLLPNEDDEDSLKLQDLNRARKLLGKPRFGGKKQRKAGDEESSGG